MPTQPTFTMIATRRSLNQIHYLIDQSGRRMENIDEIQNHCIGFYTALFGNIATPLSQESIAMIYSFAKFKCDVSMQDMLSKPVTLEEIKGELFAMPSNKSPGPDGYTAEFFKKMWKAYGIKFSTAITEFFSSGKLLKQWNCTSITLVPKKPNADRISDFRPISCCNVLYKVISKLLARRLEHILPQWISPSQSAFV